MLRPLIGGSRNQDNGESEAFLLGNQESAQSTATQKGGDNKNYILQAKAFNIFMNKTFGAATASLNAQQCENKTTIASFLKGKTGIYTIVNKDGSASTGANYTGHIDFIINGITINGTGLNPRGGILKIEIWELQ